MVQAMPRFRHKLNGSNASMIDGIEGRTSEAASKIFRSGRFKNLQLA
jgi:hypothetical protein